jgi:hypothetical protein
MRFSIPAVSMNVMSYMYTSSYTLNFAELKVPKALATEMAANEVAIDVRVVI